MVWNGAEADEILVATTGRIPQGALVLESDDGRVAVWRVPHDPGLPGLVTATSPEPLHRLLDDLGVGAGDLHFRVAAYRPGRRAVVRVRRGTTVVFLKVVRPAAAETLHNCHKALRPTVPVPASLGFSAELGLVALQGLPGTLLRRALGTPGTLPSPRTLVGFLDALPAAPERAAPERAAIASGWRVAEFTSLLARLRPRQAEVLDRLAAELTAVEDAVDEPSVPVHGDFHEAQLLVAGKAVCGVLDVDTFGSGRRLDDLATMIGHISTLSLYSMRRRAVEAYGAQLLSAFDRSVDPVALRAAAAAVILGLATGPFRVLEDRWPDRTDERIRLAARWLDSARRVAAGRRPAVAVAV
ncbi:MAG: aminoglycoside phosphotransferase family protein [Actinomycetota bacterium]|nr:aminoglycoside phosphotransferase family protein [Actinomycetota bacterium]